MITAFCQLVERLRFSLLDLLLSCYGNEFTCVYVFTLKVEKTLVRFTENGKLWPCE